MASSILYKFKAATQFESLALPGTAARLFDIKKAIVKAKRLDASPQEFDLSLKNAATNEEYFDEAMLIPRGTRLICSRLPAARGHGLLERIAGQHQQQYQNQNQQTTRPIATATTIPGLYDIHSRDRDDDEEDAFIATGDTELANLLAVTEASQATSSMVASTAGRRMAGAGPPPPRHNNNASMNNTFKPHHNHVRPNADPELREQEQKMLQPKKRATGIPRTFLSLSAPPVTTVDEMSGEHSSSAPRLQPNTMGFEQLKSRGGGQSALSGGSRRDLEYALKVTATLIPDHLLCAICTGVVRDAMLLPWDPEGRTSCETCIRDALTKNGFRCPLTGNEGVSPDDLLPNVGLRKAAEHFIGGVMEKMQEIDREQPDDQETDVYDAATNTFEGDVAEKGVIISRKTIHRSKALEDDDPFGGDDDFGGDVFAVEAEEQVEELPKIDDKPDEVVITQEVPEQAKIEKDEEPLKEEPEIVVNPKEEDAEARREARKHRAPPAGYAMGPAGQRSGPPVGYATGPATGARSAARGRSPTPDRTGHVGGGTGRGGREDAFVGRGGREDTFAGRGGRDDAFAGRGGREDAFAGRGGREDAFAGRGGREDAFAGRGGREDNFAGRGGREDVGGRGGRGYYDSGRGSFRGRGMRGGRFQQDHGGGHGGGDYEGGLVYQDERGGHVSILA